VGKFNQMTIIDPDLLPDAMAEFVPSRPQIGGQPTSIVWRTGLGPVKIVNAGFTDQSRTELVIVLADGKRYKCLSATFGGGSMPHQLVEAVKLVQASGQLVELCVALNPVSRRAAPNYFCGFRLAGSKTDADLISL